MHGNICYRAQAMFSLILPQSCSVTYLRKRRRDWLDVRMCGAESSATHSACCIEDTVNCFAQCKEQIESILSPPPQSESIKVNMELNYNLSSVVRD
jgi:hypothetical protein